MLFNRLFAAAALCLVPAYGQQWSQGDPSALEQYTAELLNRYWSNPGGFTARYLNLYASDPVIAAIVSGVQTQSLSSGLELTQAEAAAEYIRNGSSSSAAVAPLALYPLLSHQAALIREEPGSTSPFPSPSPALFQVFSWAPPPWGNPPSILAPAPTTLQQIPGTLYHLIGNEPAFSGPNATGGEAVVAAGNFNPGTGAGDDQGWAGFSGWLYSPTVVGPREYLLSVGSPGTQNSAIIHPNSTSWSASPQARHLRLMGVNVGTRVAAPGSGNTLLTVYELENEAITTNDFPYGESGTAFITGACYIDLNENGEYDPGEGVSGVSLRVSGSSWYAVSATAGGFSIPVPTGSGAVTITASATIGGQTVTQSQTVTIANDNAWIDFVFYPPRPAQSAPVPSGNGLGQITNLSTRGWTATGGGNLVAGFVISGPPGAHKTVLLRGVAWSLYPFGITTPLAKPALTLYDSAGVVLGATTTQQTDADLFLQNSFSDNPRSRLRPIFEETGAFEFIPGGTGGVYGGDTALVATLGPGEYTFALSPAADTPGDSVASGGSIQGPPYRLFPGSGRPNATQGVAMAEIYDVSVNDGAKLINLSTRGAVEEGQGSLVGGFTIAGPGNATQRLLIRGIGPALARLGVLNCLPNPVLTVLNSDASVLASDEGWDAGSQGLQIGAVSSSVGAFPLDDPSADSAFLGSFGPGSHTATVASATGLNDDIALIEIYDADDRL